MEKNCGMKIGAADSLLNPTVAAYNKLSRELIDQHNRLVDLKHYMKKLAVADCLDDLSESEITGVGNLYAEVLFRKEIATRLKRISDDLNEEMDTINQVIKILEVHGMSHENMER